jgi:uncharacterized protein YutD
MAELIKAGKISFKLLKDYREGFDEEKFQEKYIDILDKYDYVVGDWSAEKLRLKGFYHNKKKDIPGDQRYSAIKNYLKEYCAYGCAYFILQKKENKKDNKVENKNENKNENK